MIMIEHHMASTWALGKPFGDGGQSREVLAWEQGGSSGLIESVASEGLE
jgi:hypothetical protein